MGKLPSQPEQVIQHFSHPHPLQISNYQPHQTLFLASCSACKLSISGWIYTCTQCRYFLHVSCAQLPLQITHPCDQNHVLSLLSSPIYPGGLFNCDACGKQDTGFSYHCGACNIDVHTTCASKPLIVSHQSHHHPLNLTFVVPYINRSFSCDICHNFGSGQWLYRCNVCEFDAHLECTTTEPKPTPAQQVQVQYNQTTPSSAIPQYQAIGTSMVTGPVRQNFVPNTHMPVRGSSFGQGNGLNQVSQILGLNSNSQNLGKTLALGLLGIPVGGFGGGGGNGNGNGNGGGGGIDIGGILGGGGGGGGAGGGGGDLLSSVSGVDIGGLAGGIDLGGALGGGLSNF